MEYTITRRAPRHSLDLDIEVADVQTGRQIKARTKALSPFGCGVDGATHFPKGTSVRVKLANRGSQVTALARVVYASPELGMGLVFSSIESDDQRILARWIAEFVANSI